MAPDISGPGGAAGGVPIPPSAPVRPAAPSRALVPVERTGPRLPPAESPLGRSGVALDELLFAPDALETREAVTPVALDMGLETARRQLLQRQPADALTALDAVWAGAEASEEGWYLRAGALTVAGHPVEGDRIASEGLETQPQSLALRLVQSVARALVGDLSGARAALYPALEQAPDAPVLLAQQAVVLARQGHSDDAGDLLAQLAVRTPEHPALAWARGAVRAAATERTRSSARPAVEVAGTPPGHPGRSAAAPAEPGPASMAAASSVVTPDDGDMVSGALHRLGAQLPFDSPAALQQTARSLLRSCAAGGTLASACTPQEAHAARQVLATLLAVLRGDSAAGAAPPALATVVTQLLPQLRRAGEAMKLDAWGGAVGMQPATASGPGDPAVADVAVADVAVADVERVLRRQGAGLPLSVRAMLSALMGGATDAVRRAAVRLEPTARNEEGARASGDHVADVTPVYGGGTDESDLGPLVPVRLGLALLSESAATRAIERRQEVLDGIRVPTPASPDSVHLSFGAVEFAPDALRRRTGEWEAQGTPETIGEGWGGARAAHELQRAEGSARPLAAALPAIVLVAAALGAAVNGAGGLAAVLAGAAMWFAWRRPPAR